MSASPPPSPPALRTLRLDLEYDGTEFLGWQRQAEGRTVQGVVEEALERILGAKHAVVGAGRTDSGTHARGMVASFRTRATMGADDLARALDAVLPPDVGVLGAQDVPEAFHARRDASWKWYRYSLLRAPRGRPLLRRTTWHVRARLSRAVLEGVAAALEGRHDFQAFASQGSPRKTTVRTVLAARWTDEESEDLLHFDIVGDGFLYRMVRSIVGTAVAWARGRLPQAAPGAVGGDDRGLPAPGPGRGDLATARAVERLLAGRDRTAAGPVAPARGLCLMAVGVTPIPSGPHLPLFLHEPVESALRQTPPGGPL